MKTVGFIVGGIVSAFLILLGLAGLCHAAAQVAGQLIGGPQQRRVLVQADYPLCVTVKPPPIHPQKRENGAAPVADLA